MFNRRPALWLNPKQEFEEGRHHLRQNFRNALSTSHFQESDGSVFFNGFKRMMDEAQIDTDSIQCFQINLPTKHIVDAIKEEFVTVGISPHIFYSKLHQLGYCGPPMVFICLDKIIREEKFEPGDRIASFVTEVSKFMQAGYVLITDSDEREN